MLLTTGGLHCTIKVFPHGGALGRGSDVKLTQKLRLCREYVRQAQQLPHKLGKLKWCSLRSIFVSSFQLLFLVRLVSPCLAAALSLDN